MTTTELATQLETALADRRQARRTRAVLTLVAAFAALTAVILPAPFNWITYAIAVAAAAGAVVYLVKSSRTKRQAAAMAAELHELDPYLEVLPTLPKPVAKAARDIINVRRHP